MNTKTWIAGLALSALVPLAGCGNAVNNAGNAVGNAAGFVGNQVGNGIRKGANAVGNTVGNTVGDVTGANPGNNGTFRGNLGNVGAMMGSHTIQVDNATRTIHIVMANQPGNGNNGNLTNGNNTNRAGVMGGTAAYNYGGMHITIPTGWTVRLAGSRAGGDTISMVPYNSVVGPNGGANNRAAGGNNTGLYHAEQDGDVAGHNPYGVPGARTQGPVANNNQGTNNIGTQVLRANKDGTYAIVYSHPGRRNQVLDVITVSKNARVPSFSTDRNF